MRGVKRRIGGVYLYRNAGQGFLIGFEKQEPIERAGKFWIPINEIVSTNLKRDGDYGHIEVYRRFANKLGL